MRKRWLVILVSILCVAVAILFLVLVDKPFIYESEVVSTVHAVERAEPNLTLVIYTDIHHDPAKNEPHVIGKTMDCVVEVGKRVTIDALWNLGDLINGHTTTKAEAVEQINEVLAEENRVTANAHRIEGNHDNNIQATYEGNAGFGMEEVLTNAEMSSVLANTTTSQTEHHSGLRPTDYYVEFPDQGIRVICITAEETTWTEETAVWLREEALKTEDSVLFLAHIPTRPEWGFKNDVVGGELIEDELRAFVESGGTIIAYIHGHDHGDMISDAGEWKEVAIGCARFQVPTSNGTEGMTFQERNKRDVTKILFDVVCINTEKREVRFIRFGAGTDRVITY